MEYKVAKDVWNLRDHENSEIEEIVLFQPALSLTKFKRCQRLIWFSLSGKRNQ